MITIVKIPGALACASAKVVVAVGSDEAVAAHWFGVCESLRLKQAMAMAFFKIASSCACRRLAARSWRNSSAVAGSNVAPRAAATGVWAAFCYW